MSAGSGKRLLAVWLVLAAATLMSLWVGSSDGRDGLAPSAAVTVTAIVIAIVKTRIIFREFMELRHAPVLLGRLADLWLALTAVGLLGSYFLGMAFFSG